MQGNPLPRPRSGSLMTTPCPVGSILKKPMSWRRHPSTKSWSICKPSVPSATSGRCLQYEELVHLEAHQSHAWDSLHDPRGSSQATNNCLVLGVPLVLLVVQLAECPVHTEPTLPHSFRWFLMVDCRDPGGSSFSTSTPPAGLSTTGQFPHRQPRLAPGVPLRVQRPASRPPRRVWRMPCTKPLSIPQACSPHPCR